MPTLENGVDLHLIFHFDLIIFLELLPLALNRFLTPLLIALILNAQIGILPLRNLRIFLLDLFIILQLLIDAVDVDHLIDDLRQFPFLLLHRLVISLWFHVGKLDN